MMKTSTSKKVIIQKFLALAIILVLILSSIMTASAVKNLDTNEDFTVSVNLLQIVINEIFSPGEKIISVSPDGGIAVTNKGTTEISFWSVEYNKKLSSIKLNGRNYDLDNFKGVFYPDSSKFIVKSDNNEYFWVDMTTWSSTIIKDKIKGDVFAVTEDGKYILTGKSPDINIYDSTTFELKDTFSPGNFKVATYNKSKDEIAILGHISYNEYVIKIIDLDGRTLKSKNVTIPSGLADIRHINYFDNGYISFYSRVNDVPWDSSCIIDSADDTENLIYAYTAPRFLPIYGNFYLAGQEIINIKNQTVVATLKSNPKIYQIIPDKKLGISNDKIYDISPLYRRYIKMYIGDSYMTASNGYDVTQTVEVDPGRDTVPVIKDGRTLVPIRAILEAFGGTIEWNGDEQKISMSIGKNTVEMWIDKTTAKVNGQEKILDVAPEIINGRTFVPVRFVSENLNLKISWDDKTKTVTIYE